MTVAPNLGLVPPEVVDEAARIARTFCEAGSGALATMIGGDVQYTAAATEFGRIGELVDKDFGGAVLSTLAWSGDRSGELRLLLPEMAARTLVAHMMALMLGAPPDPDNTALDAEGLDAYVEAIGSFAGQGAQALRGVLGGEIKLTAAGSKIVDPAADGAAEFGDAEWLCQRGHIAFAGKASFPSLLFMSPSVAGYTAAAPASAEATLARSAEAMGVDAENLAHAMHLKVPLIVVLAKNRMRMEVIQDMMPGTILEFRKRAGDILDVAVGHVKIAEAEVVTTNQHFGVQIRRMIDPRATPKP